MNVPVLASRVALRYASLRRAGLYDIDLLRKFVQAVLMEETPENSWRTFDEMQASAVTTKHDPKAGGVAWRTASVKTARRWDGPPDSWYDPPDDDDFEPPDEDAEAAVPTAATGTFVFTLGKKSINFLMQVPEAQRAEFLTDALRVIFTKHGDYFFESALLPAIAENLSADEVEGWADWEYDSRDGDVWKVNKVRSMKVQKMEPLGRPRLTSGTLYWKFRFAVTFDVAFGYTSHRDYEGSDDGGYDDDGGGWDDGDYGPHGYSPD